MTIKLPKTIRQWFTPEKACNYLSQAFECEVELSDLDYYASSKQLFQYYKLHERYSDELVDYRVNNHISDITQLLNKHNLPDSTILELRYIIAKGEYKLCSYISAIKYLDSEEICINVNEYNLTILFSYNDDNKITRQVFEVIEKKSKYPRGKSFRVRINDGELGYTRSELDRFIKAQTEPTSTAQIESKGEPSNSQLAVIGIMLEMLLTGKDAKGKDAIKANATQNTIADAIETFADKFENRTGLAAKTTKTIFAEANKYLHSKKN